MKSTAATAEQYLATLPEDRRSALSAVRRFILDKLDKQLQECMQYGVVAYCVPHSVWPHGHHTNSKLPLMYMGLSSQKNDMVVYMLFLHHNKPEREWFDTAWKAGGAGKKSHLDVSGAGCCLRFTKLEDLSLEVIGKAIRRMPVKKYLENHVATLARIGKGPDGKPIKKSSGKHANSAPPSRNKTAKKKTAVKRG